ncbi:uncharacterized protein LACBIDRAFT_310214 [Laccaria bicolor S238N-H82]|uniref:Predicted protein n=1 Tax=Laccaria bicolor (strain S238N-H82 / ATCC MYA-4686) TaxID=486041 RepID=B0DTQ6_LACBS|nr:uncharacterized protein LACBIDRAFT_310214 [Laccaria bicolor S238N-H82]EDR02022.1 predicted protein [Laccaria bicolor S238N-H82]|eukprot:XP_001887413.1 predicted protein [Laccaria bicolor S238N-H82]
MGIDLPDISIVVQWRATCDMCTLWQCFSHAACDFSLNAIALFLVEPKHFDDTKAEKVARKEKRDGKRKSSLAAALGKRKRDDNEDDGSHRMSLPPRGWRNVEKRPTLVIFFSGFCLTPPHHYLPNESTTHRRLAVN